MDPKALGFLQTILETPSPSGYEGNVQRFVRDYVKDFADEVRTDLHGNVIVVKNPAAPLRVMFAGHCDQIGLIVQHIGDDGFLYIPQIGGWDPMVLIGQRMTVWTDNGPVFGVIARKPIHLLTEEERKQVPKIKDLWLDIGAANKEEADKIVRVGDSVTVELGFHTVRNNLAVSPAMDDKAGAWVVHRGPSPGLPERKAHLRPVRRLDGPGRIGHARRTNGRLRHRSAGRHRRRRVPTPPTARRSRRRRRATCGWAEAR